MSPPYDEPTDAAAVAACAAGDGDALAVLHRRYGGFCLMHAVALLRDRQMAEDAVQEAYLDLWRQAERFDGRSSSVQELAADADASAGR